jgi:hypothetical protein
MTRTMNLLAGLALLGSTLALPVWAASSASSAASEGASASVGSSSTSIETSSAASSPGDQKAEGPYRILQVADATDQPGKVRVALQAVRGEHRFNLLLPQETAAAQQLAAGGVITARQQPYGVNFAKADAKEPFFLVLDDKVHQELRTRPVTL